MNMRPISLAYHTAPELDPVAAVVGDYQGPATIETYTVFYKRDGSVRCGTVIGRTPSGARLLAHVPANSDATLAFLIDGLVEPVGSAGTTMMGADGRLHWQSG